MTRKLDLKPDQVDRRIHVWVQPINGYALHEEARKDSSLKYCICQQMFVAATNPSCTKRICG